MPPPAHLAPATPSQVAALRETLGLPPELPRSAAAHAAAWASRAAFEQSMAAVGEAYRVAYAARQSHSRGAAVDRWAYDPEDGDRQAAMRAFRSRHRPALEEEEAGDASSSSSAVAGDVGNGTAAAAGAAASRMADGGSDGDEDGDDALLPAGGAGGAPAAAEAAEENQSRLGSYDTIGGETRRGLWSSRYQWLPAEVAVDAAGGCRFASYINNLDAAAHGPLYGALGSVMTRFLPLFERVLAESASPACRRPRLARPYADEERLQEKWMERERAKLKRGKKKKGGDDDDDDDGELYDRWQDERERLPVPHPRVPAWAPPPVPVPVSLRDRRLQARLLLSPLLRLLVVLLQFYQSLPRLRVPLHTPPSAPPLRSSSSSPTSS